MQFNFRRAKTPAYLTSLALVVLGLLFAVASVSVLAWLLTILGIALNVMAVSITGIDDSPSRARGTGTRVVTEPAVESVDEPEAQTDQHDAVPPAGASRGGSSALRASGARATVPRPARGAASEREHPAL
ncbi:hypothetical protein [Kocuria sp.]|uniref:hypothetical protein n=1 Tax=Kocuria sp. TaxID=1871328 RepID=UPI0026DB7CF3|nr:hypothetical protein [Kocuria sp.]MDO4917910.1 hypothetical protein [Kocuria sp.]